MQLYEAVQSISFGDSGDIVEQSGEEIFTRTSVRNSPGPTVEISFETTPFLYNHRSMLDIVHNRRWARGYYCPRCCSSDISEIRSCKVSDAFNCGSCHYNFNSVSGTFFHGSKIGLHLQMRVVLAIDLLTAELPLRKIASLTGVSYKTAKHQLAKLQAGTQHSRCITRPPARLNCENTSGNIMELFERENVSIDLVCFMRRLDELLSPLNNGLSLRKQRNLEHSLAV